MYMFLMHERSLYFVSIYVCGIYLSHYIDIDTGEGQRHRDKTYPRNISSSALMLVKMMSR